MLTVNKLIPQGQGLAPVLIKRAASVELDWDVRQKSRFDAIDSQNRHLGVFLPRGTVVRGGDVLLAEDGSLVRVLAAPQAVLRVTTCATHGSAFDLTRAAYHLGNRHVALQLAPDHLKLEPDHVLADMLRQMHLIVTEVLEPFDPEAGAYAPGHLAHGAHNGHDHATHHHAHGESSGETVGPHHSHVHASAHVHGPGCQHGHGHSHHAPHVPQGDHPQMHPHGQAGTNGRRAVSIPINSVTSPTHVHGPGCGHHDHDPH